jgi:glucose 1-dehydrogenase
MRRRRKSSKKRRTAAATPTAGAIVHKTDVSNEDEVRAMFQRMFDEFGTIDILVPNAGLQQDAPIESMTLQQ